MLMLLMVVLLLVALKIFVYAKPKVYCRQLMAFFLCKSLESNPYKKDVRKFYKSPLGVIVFL